MTAWRRIGELALPWSGLLAAALGWVLTHQIGSDLSFGHCEAMTPWMAALLAIFGLALAIGGGFLARRHWKRGRAGAGARHFISIVSMMAALLLSLAILWQTAALFIIPRCFG